MMYCTCYCPFNNCGQCTGQYQCARKTPEYEEEDDDDWQNSIKKNY